MMERPRAPLARPLQEGQLRFRLGFRAFKRFAPETFFLDQRLNMFPQVADPLGAKHASNEIKALC